MPESGQLGESLTLHYIVSKRSSSEQQRFRAAIEAAESLTNVLAGNPETLLGTELCSAFGSMEKRIDAQQALEKAQALGIDIIQYDSPRYPSLLKTIYDPPLILFMKGRIPNCWDDIRGIALVGMRRADAAGIEVAHHFACECAKASLCIVSGLAMGIDAAAHTGALKSRRELSTIAVLGHGLDIRYPVVNTYLYDRILKEGGLLISQFDVGEKPYPANFLNRNRIVAGLSQAIIVIQAGTKSGSLVTARYGMEEGRDIMVVPGSIRDLRYEGSNQLIKQGAYLVSSPQDVFDLLSITPPVEEKNEKNVGVCFSSVQEKIVTFLKENEYLHYDVLAAKFPDRATFAQELLHLELQDLVRRRPGNFLALSPV